MLLHHVSHVRVVLVAVTVHHLLLVEGLLVFPSNLELGNSGLLNQHMSGKFLYEGLLRRVLIQLLLFVVVVNIVANSEEFLLVVGAGDQNASDTHDVILLQHSVVRGFSLEEFELIHTSGLELIGASYIDLLTYIKDKFHLPSLQLLHLCFFEDLIVLRV